MNVNISNIGLYVIVWCTVSMLVTYFLARKRTSSPALFAFFAFILGVAPPTGLVLILFLLAKKINHAQTEV